MAIHSLDAAWWRFLVIFANQRGRCNAGYSREPEGGSPVNHRPGEAEAEITPRLPAWPRSHSWH